MDLCEQHTKALENKAATKYLNEISEAFNTKVKTVTSSALSKENIFEFCFNLLQIDTIL